jgi:hypothetical protein
VKEEFGSFFRSVGSSIVLFFFGFEFVNSLKNLFFGEEYAASVVRLRDFEFSGIVFFEIESDSCLIIDFDFGFYRYDFLGDVLGFLSLS